jgi:hypothetical protein
MVRHIFCALIICASATTARAATSDDADVVLTAPHGKINWSLRTLSATGSGPPSLKAPNVAVARLGAERAAKADAVRNLLEAVRLMGTSGKDTAAAMLDGAADAKGRIEKILADFKTLDTRYYADGGVDLVVEFPLDGPLARTLLALPDDGATDEPVTAPTEQTGLVINAKGIKAQPVLNPRIVDENGAELYTIGSVLREPLLKQGAAAYTKSLDGAIKDARVTDKPLIVRALRVADSGPGDIVLAAADAAKLAALKPVLALGKVVIVVD